MEIIPRHKLNQWVLPETPGYRKKSRKKHWKVEGKYVGPPKNHWLGTGDRILGKYATSKDAEKAIAKTKNSPIWRDYVFKVKHI